MQPRGSGIQVVLVLRSGVRHVFEISEMILGSLEDLSRQGLSELELCTTWLQVPRTDPPAHVRVSGTRRDGSEVLIELDCGLRDGSAAVAPPQGH